MEGKGRDRREGGKGFEGKADEQRVFV